MTNAVGPADSRLQNTLRLIALSVLLGVAVYVFLILNTEDSSGLRAKLSQISISDAIYPISLSLVSYYLRFIRWRLIMNKLGYSLPKTSDAIFYLSGFALTMTPGKSGETIRSAFLLMAKVPISTSLTAFIIERSFDLFVVAALATLFFAPMIVTFLSLCAIIAIFSLFAYFSSCRPKIFRNNIPPFLQRIMSILAHGATALQFRLSSMYTIIGTAAWTAQGLGFYLIICLFTDEIPAIQAVGIYSTSLIAGAISMIPGGIGVTEGTLSWLLQNQGMEQSSAVLSALASRLCTLWLAVALGCAALVFILKTTTNLKQIAISDTQKDINR